MRVDSFPGEPAQLRAAQLRGARAILGLSLVELASAAGVSVSAVSRLERAVVARPPTAASGAIRLALEARGVRFLDGGRGSFGVLLDAGVPGSPVDEG